MNTQACFGVLKGTLTMATMQEILASNNVSVEEARNFIFANVDKPQLIFNAAVSVGLNTDMLGEIVGVSGALVRDYFSSRGLDPQGLDALPPPAGALSDYVFLTDLKDGDIFLYNPVEPSGRKIYSFDRTVTDIAVDETGNIYVSDFNTIYKYTLSSGTLQELARASGSLNALAVSGDTLYAASGDNGNLLAFNAETGALLAQTTLLGGGSAGDITFIGNDLFRTTLQYGLFKHDLVNNQTQQLTQTLDANYWGLTATADATLRAFRSDGTVTEIDPLSGQTSALPKVGLVGLNQLSGAAEALEAHVALFLG